MATATLQQAGVESARLDCLVLLEDILGVGRAHLLAHPNRTISPAELGSLNKLIVQRAGHIPLAYIRGKAPFYRRDFAVTPGVLVPRPETEMMIEMLLGCRFENPPYAEQGPHLADVGTGSGCLGITAALELPGSTVDCYDLSPEALEVARKNARMHEVKPHFYAADLLQCAIAQPQRRYDALLANLPYVPASYPVNDAARHEPKLALFAGADGLDAYRRFWQEVPQLAHQPAHILTESLLIQHKGVAQLAHAAGYRLRRTQGLIQHFTR